MPINGENVTLKVVRTFGRDFYARGWVQHLVALALQNNLPAGPLNSYMCSVSRCCRHVLVLTVGLRKNRLEDIASGAIDTAVTPLSPAALATIFSSAARRRNRLR